MGKLSALKVRYLDKPGRYSDGDGLYLLVGPNGSKSWVLRVQVEGKRRDIGLGSVKLRSLLAAREASIDMRRQLRGIATEPRQRPIKARRKEVATVLTFRQAAIQAHAERMRGWKNGKHQTQWLSSLEAYAFPTLGALPVDSVEAGQIHDVLAEIWLSKPETARRVSQRIGIVLDWAYAKGFRQAEAPMKSVSKGLPRQPKRSGHMLAMGHADVPGFLKALGEGRQSTGRLALEALILTAARSGEIRGARWDEVDLEQREWVIPAERMKAGVTHIVPLSDQAVEVFQRALKIRVPASDLVFPGQRPKQPLSDMTLLKVLRDMNVAATVHGFRSSFRDWAAEETAYPGEVAEAALAHTVSNKVEAAYRRTDFLAKRKAMMRDWGDYCTGRKGPGSPPGLLAAT
jgi:integrase